MFRYNEALGMYLGAYEGGIYDKHSRAQCLLQVEIRHNDHLVEGLPLYLQDHNILKGGNFIAANIFRPFYTSANYKSKLQCFCWSKIIHLFQNGRAYSRNSRSFERALGRQGTVNKTIDSTDIGFFTNATSHLTIGQPRNK